MVQQLRDFDFNFRKLPIKCDNTRQISLAKKLVYPSKTKHIEVRHHSIRKHVIIDDTSLEYVDTSDQLADIFTKPL